MDGRWATRVKSRRKQYDVIRFGLDPEVETDKHDTAEPPGHALVTVLRCAPEHEGGCALRRNRINKGASGMPRKPKLISSRSS